jgi:TolB-like protein/class 3 adenylate cyclase/Flp pilus assembly protein TadD
LSKDEDVGLKGWLFGPKGKEKKAEGERRLAAIMFTDMVGFTALGQRNESLSLALVEEQRKLIRPILARHNGIKIKTMGDAFLVEFPNALDSVKCAYDIQRATREFNISLPEEKRIHLRVGLHLGDVVESKGDISGDAVNVASRIEPLAEDGGVCITRQVYDQVANKFELPLTSLGPKALKNVSEPVEVFEIVMPWEKQIPPKEEASFPRSRIAILPFANMSPDPNDEYFADGMTEEIISTVSGISGLGVISRTSVMGYKGTNKRVKEIGRELEVGSVLEGSFRKAGNRIRVTTQLISVADDEHLWAQNYDRNLDDVFEVQSDVAKHVADALRVKILLSEKERIEKKPTESTAAYALHLKGRYYWNRRGLEDLKKASEYFELAVHEDSGFALGYVGQADSCMLLRDNWNVEPEANLERAKAMADKALELDPGLAEAHASKAALLVDDYDFRHAEEEFRRAIELKPSYATAHHWYYMLLFGQTRWDEAREQIEKAVELDPLSPVIHLNHGNYYLGTRDYSRAIEPFRRAAELGYTEAHEALAIAYGRMKKFDDMKRESAAYVELSKDLDPLAKLFAHLDEAYLMGDKKTVSQLLPELEAHFHDYRGYPAYHIGALYFYLGENDKGFEWLDRSYSEKDSHMLEIKYDQDLDGVRTDPRYLDLLKRLGLD